MTQHTTMFESQWPESARKRAREEDEHGGITAGSGSIGFTEHRNVSSPHHSIRPSPYLRGSRSLQGLARCG